MDTTHAIQSKLTINQSENKSESNIKKFQPAAQGHGAEGHKAAGRRGT
jgi:hypothetical protein